MTCRLFGCPRGRTPFQWRCGARPVVPSKGARCGRADPVRRAIGWSIGGRRALSLDRALGVATSCRVFLAHLLVPRRGGLGASCCRLSPPDDNIRCAPALWGTHEPALRESVTLSSPSAWVKVSGQGELASMMAVACRHEIMERKREIRCSELRASESGSLL
jgi:hypothetical protein